MRPMLVGMVSESVKADILERAAGLVTQNLATSVLPQIRQENSGKWRAD